jgi:hypothetical protein
MRAIVMAKPFLHCHHRFKNGKDHCYWSIVEKVRTARGWVQLHILYLGEINDSQREAWTKVTDVFDPAREQTRPLALYPADRAVPGHAREYGVQVRWGEFVLRRPRQWGACGVGCKLWDQLPLEEFWRDRLPDSREGTCWRHVLQTLRVYRLLDPGSEWRLHRQWFQNCAMADVLDEDFGLAEKDNLYRCLDKLLPHRAALFEHLRRRWEDLFGVKHEVLLYDLTSPCFESDPPFPEKDKRPFGYSRDKRSDCVQVVIALGVTPEGFPLACEVMSGNTADKTTRRGFLAKIEELYGKAERVWGMDRGIPTEEVLAEMRAGDPPVRSLVEAVGAGPDAAQRPGQICGHANARRAFPHHRWSGTELPALHPAGKRPEDAPGAIEVGTGAAIAAAHHAERTTGRRITLVQTF